MAEATGVPHDDSRRVAYSDGEILRRRVRRATLLVVDDHRLLAQMLVDHLVERGHEALSVDVSDRDLLRRVIEIEPDLVVLDAVFSDDEQAGRDILRGLRREGCQVDVVILTGVLDRVRQAEMLEEGAVAVISKADSFERVIQQIEDVVVGIDTMGAARRSEMAQLLAEHRRSTASRETALACLTSSEMATLQGLLDGISVEEMARIRTVAKSTVRSHVRAILRKLAVHSQLEAVAVAAKAGMNPSPPID